eukprot:TRINITY_DN2430_c0_g2_i1.p1 TRINITY_DN2430_c0_g2~~TRINITY_DN2430_c0_g2_i1.p1  ORF type:complete len:345 (-),score=34.69 TRINITY_DN2430_c0_g2_i1:162-1196(-)
MWKCFVFIFPCLCAALLYDTQQEANLVHAQHLKGGTPCDGLDNKKCSAKLGCDYVDHSCGVRIAWLHVMKCGSSFGTTLAHFANTSLPDTAHIPSGENMSDPEDTIKEGLQGEPNFFRFKYPVGRWFTNVFRNPRNPGNHLPILPEEWEEWRHGWFGVFREPASRALSSYNHFGQGKGDLKDWLRRIQGQQASMLSSGQAGFARIRCEWNQTGAEKWCAQTVPPNIDLAIHRLHHFAFVGIIEEFDLSVCLFHKMFGSDCLDVEFMNMRPGDYDSDEEKKQDLAVLKAQGDPWDEPVYAAATRRFWSDVHKYNLRPSVCNKICPSAPSFKTATPGDHDVFPATR